MIAIRQFRSDDTAWLIAEHARHYAVVEGFDATFEALVARSVAAFVSDHDPSCERAWIAHEGGAPVGSIFCARADAQSARLRLFYVVASARRRGVGQDLLRTLTGFATDAGYRRLCVATYASHAAAGRLYARSGFTLTASFPVENFGCSLVEQNWEKPL